MPSETDGFVVMTKSAAGWAIHPELSSYVFRERKRAEQAASELELVDFKIVTHKKD